MKIYIKVVEGRQVVKPCNKIIVYKDDMLIINPTHEMLIEDGWQEYIAPIYEPTEEELLEQDRHYKLLELIAYDESSEVNDCIIRYQGLEVHYWAIKTDRDSLKGVLRDYISLGKTEYRLDLRELGIYLTIPCELLLGMLARLEVYASECYNKTTDHEYAIKLLTTIDEIKNYNYRTDYPEKLTFNL